MPLNILISSTLISKRRVKFVFRSNIKVENVSMYCRVRIKMGRQDKIRRENSSKQKDDEFEAFLG